MNKYDVKTSATNFSILTLRCLFLHSMRIFTGNIFIINITVEAEVEILPQKVGGFRTKLLSIKRFWFSALKLLFATSILKITIKIRI